MEINENVSSGYRVLRSGNNIIYTGKICKEGAAEFQLKTYDAISELKKRESHQLAQAKQAAATNKANGTNGGNGNGSKNGGNGSQQQQAKGHCLVACSEKLMRETMDKSLASSVDGLQQKNNNNSIGRGLDFQSALTQCSENQCKTLLSEEDVDVNNAEPQEIKLGAPNPPKQQQPESEPEEERKPDPPNGNGSTSNGNNASSTTTTNGGSTTSSANNTLRFHFTSAGGNLPAGITMMDMVEEAGRLGYETECYSKGFVGSACTFPAFSCKQRFSAPHCLFLLHPPAKSGVQGQTEEMKIHSENLDLWHTTSEGIYQRLKKFTRGESEEHKQRSAKEIVQTFSNNRYNSAQDIVRMGLIDHLLQ